MRNLLTSFALIALLLATNVPVRASEIPSRTMQITTHTVTLAGAAVEVDLPFVVPAFIQPAADDALQTAPATRWSPFFEVSLEAVSVTEDGSPATGEGLRQTIRNVRAEQSPRAQKTHRIDFFGSEVDSTSNRVEIHLVPTVKQPVTIHEWVTEWNDAVWILRVSFTPNQGFDEALLDQIAVRAGQEGAAAAPLEAGALALPALSLLNAGDLLPEPMWWDGDCDTNFYASKSGGRAAYPLAGVYRGVKACGPRPTYDYAPSVLARFYTGAWGVLEWQCVELSLRFLYLAYQVPPYSGHGKDIVANYRGTRLVKIANGLKGKTPLPGDVLSYGPTTTYGHTSVVAASNVDASGNGTVTVIEQNSSAAGTRNLAVKNWFVQASITVSGWLHEAKPGAPANLSTTIDHAQVLLTWTAAASTTIEGYRVYRNGAQIAAVSPTTTRYLDTMPLCVTNAYSITAFQGPAESDPTQTAVVDVNVPCRFFLPQIRTAK